MTRINKTRTVATDKKGARYVIEKSPHGWPCPRTIEGRHGGHVDGSWAYQTCCERWEAMGYTIEREPNPLYRGRTLESFFNFLN